MSNPIVIVGAGPAGLSCARILAEKGHRVLVLERKGIVGKKVCAGGITCNGILNQIPHNLIQKSFTTQFICSSLQQFTLEEKKPILATVNREELGKEMLDNARCAGVEVQYNSHVISIDSRKITIMDKNEGKKWSTPYSRLVGADGANSIVRKYLGLSSNYYGIGINYQVPFIQDKMEWHFKPDLFKNGYAWIFPHKETTSIGAYACSSVISPTQLKASLHTWASQNSLDLENIKPRAEKILYDYKGWKFNNIFLIGEAAGLTSAITGEGINSAVLSGEIVAEYIDDSTTESVRILEKLIVRHRMHFNLSRISSSSRLFYHTLPEVALLGLKLKFIPFSKLELAP